MLPDLRINPPRLEPDPVLLEQLSQLSSASAARGATGHTARSLLSGATVVVVAGLSWLTGTLPGVAVSDAIKAAEKRVPDGKVTDAELTRENQRTVWDVAVEVSGGDDWELWIDASSGKVINEERD